MIITGFALTDKGIQKPINQDSVLLKIAEDGSGNTSCIAIVCDGMGGHENGELASATVIDAFLNWFDDTLNKNINTKHTSEIRREWELLIFELNERLVKYGKKNNITLGTTLSAILILNNQYIIANVGDSRVYLVDRHIKQLTEDQSFVARELKAGRITEEEAKIHPKRNALLQCIGVSKNVSPDFIYGEVKNHDKFLICSDGFRHVISNDEILSATNPLKNISDSELEEKYLQLIETIKLRGETDNISVILLEIQNLELIGIFSTDATLNLEDATIDFNNEQSIDIKCEQIIKSANISI